MAKESGAETLTIDDLRRGCSHTERPLKGRLIT